MTRRRQPQIHYQDPGVHPLGRDTRTGTHLVGGRRVAILDTVQVAKETRQLRRAREREQAKQARKRGLQNSWGSR